MGSMRNGKENIQLQDVVMSRESVFSEVVVAKLIGTFLPVQCQYYGFGSLVKFTHACEWDRTEVPLGA